MALDWSRTRVVAVDAVGTLILPAEPVAETYTRFGRRLGASLTAVEVGPRFANAFKTHFRSDLRNRERKSEWDTDGTSSELLERRRWLSVIEETFRGESIDSTLLFEQLWGYYAAPEAWRIHEAVPKLFESFGQRNFIWGIASNFDQRLHGLVDQLTPLSNARFVFTSADLGWDKATPNFYRELRHALPTQPGCDELTNVPSSFCCMVGDDVQNDVVSAVAAGWTAVHIKQHSDQPDPGLGESLSTTLESLARLASTSLR